MHATLLLYALAWPDLIAVPVEAFDCAWSMENERSLTRAALGKARGEQ